MLTRHPCALHARSAFNWTSRPRETPYSRPSVVGDGGAGASLTGRRSLDLVALSSRSLSTSVNSATTLEQAAPNPRPLPAVGYEPSFSPRPLPALSCESSVSGLRSLQPQGPPLLSPAHEQLSGTIEQRRYAPRLSGPPPASPPPSPHLHLHLLSTLTSTFTSTLTSPPPSPPPARYVPRLSGLPQPRRQLPLL